MANLSNIPKKIFNFFNKEAQRIAKETGFTKRCSKLTPQAFMRALVSSCLTQQFGLEVFCSFLQSQGIQITRQGLHERYNSSTELFLKELSALCLKQFKTEKLSQINFLDKFSGVNIVDSSTISLHHSLHKLFKGSGGAASSASMKIQLMMDYLQGQITALTLTSGCENDQSFDHYFRSIQKGALYLMDLGYFKLSSFQNIINGHAFFVSRLLTGTKLLTLDGKPIELVKTLSNSSNVCSLQVLMGAKYKIPIRLVAQRLPQELADKRRRRLKEDHRRRGSKPSADSLALQAWSIYITNADEKLIANHNIHQIYALRWQIELCFKLSKSLIQIHTINSRKPSRVVIETYGKFITMMMLFLMCEPIRKQHQKELSLYKACKLLLIRVNEFNKALTSKYHCKKFLTAFYESLLLFANKDKKINKKNALCYGERF